ncbi:multicopper oxidase [Plakobranchus ocellatus]|uniref:Multicopper oxidase n=1 Tax=Plakobranchus ocellatus TaxID=259542 RepID=A0AAV3YLK6_9GAST|nr:multicopper oxidase [Plakobranchus ocellatus]
MLLSSYASTGRVYVMVEPRSATTSSAWSLVPTAGSGSTVDRTLKRSPPTDQIQCHFEFSLLQKMLAWAPVLLLLCVYSIQADIYANPMDDYTDHPCKRPCDQMSPARLCKYQWRVESYWTLSKACFDCPFNKSDCFLPHCVSTDGVSRGITVVNRKLPGPSIEVCEGDTLEVEVYNDMQNSEGTSIHWHGILQQGTPFMDGVTLITQCPITSHSKFTYRFVARDPGTHYWHGHAGMQRADGLFGALVVRQAPLNEVHYTLYDYDLSEHVMIVNDWLVQNTLMGFVAHHHDDGHNNPALMLINGLGAHEKFTRGNEIYYTPRATFTVQGGKKYRFRVMGAAFMDCPIQISVDGHTMMMIASDGNPFEPFTADSFNIFAGERYDFVLYADKISSLRNYWIRARGLAQCQMQKAHQVALLKYAGAPDVDPPEPTDWDSSIRGGIKVDNLKFNHPDFYPLAYLERSKHLYTPQMNRISSVLPGSPPLSQYDDVLANQYCNEFTLQSRCDKDWCKCTHKLDVALEDLVELVVVGEGVTFNSNHPMHLHGFRFRILKLDKVNTSMML